MVGDFDSDSDVAVAGCAGVAILFGRGDGTFIGPLDLAADSEPASVVAADLDGDSDFDLAVANNFVGREKVG